MKIYMRIKLVGSCGLFVMVVVMMQLPWLLKTEHNRAVLRLE
jgi:hypothetical protein